MRSAIRVGLASLLSAIALLTTAAGAGAQADDAGGDGVIEVVQVSGLIDPVLADFVEERLTDAERRFAVGEVGGLVLQLNSGGAVVSDARLIGLVDRLRAADVPIGVWVGPPGATATGRAALLLMAADVTGIAEGSRLGDLGDPVDGAPVGGLGPATAELRDRTVEREEAGRLELVDTTDSTLGDFVLSMSDLGAIGLTTDVVDRDVDGEVIPQRQIVEQVRLRKLGLVDQLFHTVASANIAYLLLLAGLGLLLLELFTAGVGVAGATGVVALVLASYGLGVLPTRGWALGLLVGAVVAFAVDVQAGAPRFWTGMGTVALLVGTLFLFDGGVATSWLARAAGLVSMFLLVLVAMPNLVRTRFGTNTLGREGMVGQVGAVVDPVDPDGTIRVHGGLWPARTNRATPLGAGDEARVASIDGLVLEVEPLEGAARDHRERRRRTTDADTPIG